MTSSLLAGRVRAVALPVSLVALALASAGCGKSDAKCRASTECSFGGRCHPAGDTCVAKSDADCEASGGCKRNGTCSLAGGKCGATKKEQCASSESCRSEGRCTLDEKEPRCVPGSDEDCNRSEGCKKGPTRQRKCRFDHQTLACVDSRAKNCTDWLGCRDEGLCARVWVKSGFDSDEKGNVEVKRAVQCGVGDDADCRRAAICKQRGYCARVGNRCGATSDADCQASESCKISGFCKLDPAHKGYCMSDRAATSPPPPRATPWPKLRAALEKEGYTISTETLPKAGEGLYATWVKRAGDEILVRVFDYDDVGSAANPSAARVEAGYAVQVSATTAGLKPEEVKALVDDLVKRGASEGKKLNVALRAFGYTLERPAEAVRELINGNHSQRVLAAKAGKRVSVVLNDFGPTLAGKAKNAVAEAVGLKVAIVSASKREAAAGLLPIVTAALK